MGLDRLFQDVLSFSLELVGGNVLCRVFIPRLERETRFALFLK